MQINDLYKYGEDELNYFKCLTMHEKIEFIDTICNTGVEKTLDRFIAIEHDIDQLPVMSQTINFRNLGILQCDFFENEIHVYSNSLKSIKIYMKKLFEDGNILCKLKIRKPKDLEERYYFAYEILPNTLPLCPN